VFDFKQCQRIKEGDTLPMDESLLVLEEGSSEPKAVTLKELCGGKRAVLFGLPGGCCGRHKSLCR
jgi:peroxiredoxin